MSAVTYLTDEKDWARALDNATSLELLRAVVQEWMPYVPDALAVVEKMDDTAFVEWREGLAVERSRKFAGVEFAEKFGELLMPTEMMRASMLSEDLKVPFGLALVRVKQAQENRR